MSVIQLVERRPPVKDPWTPRDLLVELLQMIDDGKVEPSCLMVFYMIDNPDGTRRPETWSANVSHAEAIAFCALEMNRTIDQWRT